MFTANGFLVVITYYSLCGVSPAPVISAFDTRTAAMSYYTHHDAQLGQEVSLFTYRKGDQTARAIASKARAAAPCKN